MDYKKSGGIDLHIHSDASDGSHAPAEIVQSAVQLGLQAIAITDHDTVAGARQAAQLNIPDNLDFLTGVEISTQPPAACGIGGSLHILGYGIDTNHPALCRALEDLQEARAVRTPRIVERLNRSGISVTMDQVMAEVGNAAPGRPHVASVLVKMGVVSSIDDAFTQFLNKGCPAYVDKYRIDCRHTFDLIRDAGGISVLAHPSLITCDSDNGLPSLVQDLCEMGLMGLEAYYPEHSPETTARLLEMASRYKLLVTGGTDFHGDITPGIQMGRGRGDLFIPYSLYEALVSAISNNGETD